MPVAVVKLGSSVVAQREGRAAAVRRRPRLRGGRRPCTAPASTSSSSRRARSRAGSICSTCPCGPTRSPSCRRRARWARAGCTARTTTCCASRALPTAQILLTFFDMSARTHYLNARRTLRTLLGWRVVPVINENDTTTTDEISFGDNDFLAAQVAVLLGAELLVLLTDTDGLYTANPRLDPAARLVDEVTRPRGARRRRDRPRDLAARLGRDALEGRGRGDGHRGRHPDDHRERVRARLARRALGGRARRHALRAPGRARTRASSSGSSTRSPRTAR